VIYIWLGFFMLVGASGLFWYALNDQVITLLDELIAEYPGYYPDPVVTFIKSVWHWFPFLIMLGGLVWVYVTAQRRPYPEGYL